jgi:hypothetical protein
MEGGAMTARAWSVVIALALLLVSSPVLGQEQSGSIEGVIKTVPGQCSRV